METWKEIHYCTPFSLPGYRPYSMEGMRVMFNRFDHPGVITGIRRSFEILKPVVCPKCSGKTKRVIDYLGKLYFNCTNCGRSW